jgi:probable rRNA maturation factor
MGSSGAMKVRIADRQDRLRIPQQRITNVLRCATPLRWRKAEISVAIVSGREMAILNRRYTGRRGQTDVLAFALEDDVCPFRPTVGEIVVNASRAMEEAAARGASPLDELLLYVLHGGLHLLGYDDQNEKDRRRMYAREESVMKRAGVPYVRHHPAREPARRRKEE